MADRQLVVWFLIENQIEGRKVGQRVVAFGGDLRNVNECMLNLKGQRVAMTMGFLLS